MTSFYLQIIKNNAYEGLNSTSNYGISIVTELTFLLLLVINKVYC